MCIRDRGTAGTVAVVLGEIGLVYCERHVCASSLRTVSYTHLGVLKGYPDGSFQPNKTSTRAEAVVMIQRMLEEMEEGLNPDITVVARYEEGWKGESIVQEEETNRIQLQIVDNIIYASVKAVSYTHLDVYKRQI